MPEFPETPPPGVHTVIADQAPQERIHPQTATYTPMLEGSVDLNQVLGDANGRAYTAKERAIFPYVAPPGSPMEGQQLYADPIRIARRLAEYTNGGLQEIIDLANLASPKVDLETEQVLEPAQAGPGSAKYTEALQARGLLAEAAMYAFELRPFDPLTGAGCLEEEAMLLLSRFQQWRSQKKTSGPTS